VDQLHLLQDRVVGFVPCQCNAMQRFSP
jgi:hypothetical protein